MATVRQKLGTFGEKIVKKKCRCPSCKIFSFRMHKNPNNPSTDLVCSKCGVEAQVKSTLRMNINYLPKSIMGAGWRHQEILLQNNKYHHLYIVVKHKRRKDYSIYFIPSEIQDEYIFVKRNPLSENAKRAGWVGFTYNLRNLINKAEKIV